MQNRGIRPELSPIGTEGFCSPLSKAKAKLFADYSYGAFLSHRATPSHHPFWIGMATPWLNGNEMARAKRFFRCGGSWNRYDTRANLSYGKIWETYGGGNMGKQKLETDMGHGKPSEM